MLTEVVLQTSNPMTFKINDVDSDEILILESVSGLTPQDVQIYAGEFSRSGGYYQGRRFGSRYPVFKFKLNEDYVNNIDIEEIRDMLYRQFYQPQADSDGVTVVLKSDKFPDRFITCYGEKWDGEIFSKETKGNITTRTVDAFIMSTQSTSASNPGGWLTVPINYDGSADTGLVLKIKVVADTNSTGFKIENNGQIMHIQYLQPANAVFDISTVEGDRYVRRDGGDQMTLLSSDSDWIQLRSAANTLRVYGDVPGDGKVVVTEYSYRSAWLGA